MGSTDYELHECIGCESTYTCRLHELKAIGWDQHKLADGRIIVLCDECKQTYAERRHMREVLSA